MNVGALNPLNAAQRNNYVDHTSQQVLNPAYVASQQTNTPGFGPAPKGMVWDVYSQRLVPAGSRQGFKTRLGGIADAITNPIAGFFGGTGTDWDRLGQGHVGANVDAYGRPVQAGELYGSLKKIPQMIDNPNYDPNAVLKSQNALPDRFLRNSILGNAAALGLGKIAQIGQLGKMDKYLQMAHKYNAAANLQSHLFDTNQMQQFVKSDFGQAKIAGMYADAKYKRQLGIAAQQQAANEFGGLGLNRTSPYAAIAAATG
jgi:hypothetical protein